MIFWGIEMLPWFPLLLLMISDVVVKLRGPFTAAAPGPTRRPLLNEGPMAS